MIASFVRNSWFTRCTEARPQYGVWFTGLLRSKVFEPLAHDARGSQLRNSRSMNSI